MIQRKPLEFLFRAPHFCVRVPVNRVFNFRRPAAQSTLPGPPVNIKLNTRSEYAEKNPVLAAEVCKAFS
jgi:hypothetical protein